MRKVSVIITIFNNSEFLTKCINSILRQSYSPKELILIDDGSLDDNTKKIYLKFKINKKKIKLKFYKIKNIGPSGARNFGLRKINHNYFCFFDPDDYMKKNFIRNKMLVFKKNTNNKIVGTYSNARIKNNKKFKDINYKIGLSSINNIDTIGYQNGISGSLPTYIFYKPLIPYSLKFDENISINEDFDFIIRLLKKKINIIGINNHDLIINSHNNSLTRSSENIDLVYKNQREFINKAFKLKYFSKKEINKRLKYIESLSARSYLKKLDIINFIRHSLKYLSI